MEKNFNMEVDVLLVLEGCRKNYMETALLWAQGFPNNPKSRSDAA